MEKQIGGEEMRQLGRSIQKQIPGLGFCLLVFAFDEPGMANYLSNADRSDMIKALKEAIKRLSDGKDIPTPETN